MKILDRKTVYRMLDDFNKGKKRCIMLDYDGTLAPFQKLPSMATPSNELLQVLVDLSTDEKNEITIISGRDGETLEKWLGQLPMTLVAEHGACVRFKGDAWQLLVSQSSEWKEEIRPLLQTYVSRCAGSFIEEKKNTLAWHYRNAVPDEGVMQSRDLLAGLLQLTRNTPLQVIDGNKVLEVRLTGVDKGATALTVLNRFNPDFTICLGDDTTDEDMFKVLKDRAYTIKIGSGSTAAQYTLSSQTDVLPLLRNFIAPVNMGQFEDA